MTFSSIIRKNFIHNVKKFMSIYFVNTLIIAMLFIFGSLMFNSDVLEQVGKTTFYETIKLALLGLVLFSIVFITYSNISFLKYRGKEFGMYFTLGMTTKDLIRLLFIENVSIIILSVGSGLAFGSIFGKMFYLGLNKILPYNPVNYELHVNSFLLSIGVFLIIFLCNFIFTIFYIKRVSIIDVLKSSKRKEVGKNSITLGIVAIVLFIVSAYLLPKILLKELFADQSYMIGVCIAFTLICPYVIIGTMITVFKAIMKRFRKSYNNNLLVLSNLSHRFLAYKNTLYMVSILLAGAIFFVGLSYSFYASSEMNNDRTNPYDVMFVESDQFNHINRNEVEKILNSQGSSVNEYSTLEYLELAEFRKLNDELGFWTDASSIVSESNYNKHMKTHYNVKPNEAISVQVHEEKMKYKYPDTILAVLKEEQLTTLKDKLVQSDSSEKEKNKLLLQALKNETYVSFSEKQISQIYQPFTNVRWTSVYSSGDALIVDDKLYANLKEVISTQNVKMLHLVKGDITENSFLSLISALRKINHLDTSYWIKGTQYGSKEVDEERRKIENHRPIFKEELLQLQLEANGLILFIMIFMGALFTIASGVVLYYKVLTDIEDEKERIISLKRIGITVKETKRMISKELAIIFFLPTFIGMGLGMYYIYVMFSNDPMVAAFLIKSVIVCGSFLLMQILLYFISRRKYFSELGKIG